MSKQPNYARTRLACYIGFITQAIDANFAPLLFLTFKSAYGIPLEKIALIPTAFFLTQLLTDLAATKLADRLGYRVCVVVSHILSAAGLALLALLPALLPDPFAGIMLAVVLYAVGSGLIEVLVSPIIEACPFEHKESMMSLLHSFYCWGSVGVILGSTVFFAAFGIENWRILTLIWALVPLCNIFNFLTCPIERLVEEGRGMSIGKLVRLPLFWGLVALMVCAGASELSMSQWASAFTESATGVSKTVGDLAGPCLFAALMGVSRVIYSKMGDRLDLVKVMLGSGVLCVGCYLLAGLSSAPVLGLMGCAVCGVSVGVLWPGTISIAARKCPAGGTALFALLALAGDLGGTAGPALVGRFSALAGGDLKSGLLAAVLFPAAMILVLILVHRSVKTAP